MAFRDKFRITGIKKFPTTDPKTQSGDILDFLKSSVSVSPALLIGLDVCNRSVCLTEITNEIPDHAYIFRFSDSLINLLINCVPYFFIHNQS